MYHHVEPYDFCPCTLPVPVKHLDVRSKKMKNMFSNNENKTEIAD